MVKKAAGLLIISHSFPLSKAGMTGHAFHDRIKCTQFHCRSESGFLVSRHAHSQGKSEITVFKPFIHLILLIPLRFSRNLCCG